MINVALPPVHTTNKMHSRNITAAIILIILVLGAFETVLGQEPALIKRTTTKTDAFDFGSGGTLSVVGAPNGSIRIEGWNNNQIQIEAVIELFARTEADLNELSRVTGFTLDEALGKTSIISVGTHNKSYMKRAAKKFPKHLLGLPYRIDYVIKVPRYCDLQIDGGKGDLFIGGIDGTMKVNFIDSNARLDLLGGGIFATFGGGTVDVTVPTRGWRGRFADIQLAAGSMNVSLPPSLNAEVDASILRTGSITNDYTELKPKTRRDIFTDKLIAGKTGVGGIPLKFTVGDGELKIFQAAKP